jgi:hypothetical protein
LVAIQTNPLTPTILPYKQYRVSFLGVRQLGRGVDHPHPLSASQVRGELYLLYLQTVSAWHIQGQPLLLDIAWMTGKAQKLA